MNCLLLSGYAFANRCAMPVISAFAWSSEIPGLSVAMIAGLVAFGSLRGLTGNSGNSGIQSSSLVGNAKPFGITPTIVAGLPLIRTPRPRMSDAPPKSRCQMPYPMMATFSAPGRLSAAVKSRPIIGLLPRILRKSSVT